MGIRKTMIVMMVSMISWEKAKTDAYCISRKNWICSVPFYRVQDCYCPCSRYRQAERGKCVRCGHLHGESQRLFTLDTCGKKPVKKTKLRTKTTR